VACQRGVVGRVEKGFNVLQGGAAGMVLYNQPLADVETDNHWLPTVHLADGTDFVAFVSAHPGAIATFTAGQKTNGQGDVMAAFSSRGPAGQFIKPDITAPGVQILAGHSPTPESVAEGPPGQLFQAIAGHLDVLAAHRGSAILVAALHPTWTPGQIKSALMTTATTNVVQGGPDHSGRSVRLRIRPCEPDGGRQPRPHVRRERGKDGGHWAMTPSTRFI
jgi:hypothetical protein